MFLCAVADYAKEYIGIGCYKYFKIKYIQDYPIHTEYIDTNGIGHEVSRCELITEEEYLHAIY